MTPQWSLAKRVGFRFLFIYLALYCLSMILRQEVRSLPWEALVSAVGRLLNLDARVYMTGSGDQTFFYVQALCFLLVALVGMLIWSAVDRERPNYRTLYLALRVLVRCLLGYTLISYGADKLLPTQMPLPDERRLLEAFGEASPMGLLWTFMGASPAYQSFTGGIELLCGVLLFFRRTVLLGALLAVVAMTQVVALNLAYDVPVKLASMHYLGMAMFLAAADTRRLANVLVLNRPAEAAPMDHVLQKPLFLRGAFVLKLLFVTWAVGTELFFGYGRMLQYASTLDRQKYPLLNRGFHWISETPYNQ